MTLVIAVSECGKSMNKEKRKNPPGYDIGN